MSKRIKLLAAAVILFSSFTLSAQSSDEAQSYHPKVQQYVDMLELTEQQTVELQAVYTETAARGIAIDEQIKETRLSQRNKAATPSEKDKVRDEMNVLSKERIALLQERDEKLQEIMTPEQKQVFEASK